MPFDASKVKYFLYRVMCWQDDRLMSCWKLGMRYCHHLFILVFCLFFSIESHAQSRCGTVILQQEHLGAIDYRVDEKKFEKWLSEKMSERSQDIAFGIAGQKQILSIPVVVHVLHNGQAIGVDGNIPDDQILSQITILNQDFRRLNPDASETPAEFLSVAADVEIEFVLAKRDPEGLPTTGIVRSQGSQFEYNLFDDVLLKSESFWPTEDYLNIWVTDLSNDLLGYAQFPVSNLTGLTVNRDSNGLTDGVVVDYEYFGTGFNNDPFSKGRTATHEIGHFLGLRHVWGDGGCSADDFCVDTPQMSDNSSGCPVSQNSCGSNDMFQNYMDFTDDVCMNLFTSCQANRMQTVLAESPRRRTLLTSIGGIAPVVTTNDIGIRQIISPEVSICSSNVVPEIEVRNYGIDNVTSFRVILEIDNQPIDTIESTSILEPLQILTLIFQSIDLEQGSELNFTFRITEVNGVTDGNAENDIESIFVQVPAQLGFPIIADFENGNDNWMTRKLNGEESNWQRSNAHLNQVFKLDIFNSTSNEFGNLEMLLSPVLDLEKVSAAELQFKYAYAPVPANANFIDGLVVAVLTECGNDFNPENILSDFELYGNNLGTTTATSSAFTPAGPAEWDDAVISLNRFLGLKNVQVAIIAQNGGGNNIFVDDAELFANNQFNLDVKVAEIKELPLISCRNFQAPIVEIKNFGTETINSIDYEFGVTNSLTQGRLDGITLEPGELQNIAVGVSDLNEGEFKFIFTVLSVNDSPDDDLKDNTLIERFRITEQEDALPLREQFEQRTLDELNWFPFSITGEHNWTFSAVPAGSGENQAIVVNAFSLDEVGTQNWLVSPKLDLFELSEASMSFKVSYANRLNRDDQLQVVVSTDCGRNFENIVYDRKGAELAVTSSNTEWIPESEEDWITEFIDLSAFVGSTDVLIAFVFTNSNGNNLYLDDLDFFVSSDPNLLDLREDMVRIFPNPSPDDFNVTFNLIEKENVHIRLMDMMGKQIINQSFENVLNQTLSFETFNLKNGIYLVQFIGESFNTRERVVVMK